MTIIPYKGTAPVMNDLLGGHVPVAFGVLPPALGNIESGTLRALAVTGKARFSLLPNVPTVDESGLPGFDAVLHYGLLAPAGTPRPIVDQLNGILMAFLKRPDVTDKLQALAIDTMTSTPDELATFIPAEITKWAQVVKDAGIVPE
jgi:tripartite-type tricarboxylate transporter receptor subunit TctC